ncbi:MAG: methionine synthase [Chloroflexi bacterium]|nr:methionine synthase [Chloroflexota bacterium]
MSRRDLAPKGQATVIGSLPHTDPQAACSLVMKYLPQLPAWPQLPKRSFLENMYVQFSQGFPGVRVEGGRIYVADNAEKEESLSQLYRAYLEDNSLSRPVTSEYAAGLYAFLDTPPPSAMAVKGQVVGPVSWGLTVTNEERRSVLYDEVLADALAKHLRLKATWQEKMLQKLHPQTVIFVDEPYLSALGSAFVSVPRELVVSLLEEVFQGIQGFKGVHCCGNTDWSLLLETSVDILSLDAYNYAETFGLYPYEVEAFLRRGGIIAWGLVPNEPEPLKRETPASLTDRWEAAAAALSRKGVTPSLLRERWLVTPSCGLSGLSEDGAAQALELTALTAALLREKYLKD